MIFFIIILSLCGVLISWLSLYEHIAISAGLSPSIAICDISKTFTCAPALNSEWATVFGIPLASYGMLFFGVFLVLAVLSFSDDVISKKTSNSAMFALAFFASLFSIFLFFISSFVVKAFCPLCLGTYLVCFLLLFCVWRATAFSGVRESLIHFFRSLALLPKLLLSTAKSGDTAVGRVSLLSLLLAAALIFVLPDFVINHFILAEAEREQAVANWQVEQLDDLGLVLNEGAVASDYGKGDPKAPIQLVEFSDFECPACRKMYFYLEALIEKYGDKVFFVYRNFPLDRACNPLMQQDMHHNACFAAEYVRCAGEQNKFWEVSDYLIKLPAFDSDESPEKVRAAIQQSGSYLGLDNDAMEECIASGRQKGRITSDIKDARRLSIGGTPALWINGRRVRQATPQGIEAIFEHILKDR